MYSQSVRAACEGADTGCSIVKYSDLLWVRTRSFDVGRLQRKLNANSISAVVASKRRSVHGRCDIFGLLVGTGIASKAGRIT